MALNEQSLNAGVDYLSYKIALFYILGASLALDEDLQQVQSCFRCSVTLATRHPLCTDLLLVQVLEKKLVRNLH